MKYSSWMSKKDIKKNLNQTQSQKGGIIPLIYENDQAYGIDIANTIVIGSSGSGKTQNIILPTIKSIIKNNESFIINDQKGEMKQATETLLKEQKYNVIDLSFENPQTKHKWNPFELPKKLYKENKKEEALNIIEETMTILFQEPAPPIDPFWTLSARDLATGTVLYLLENNKEVTLKEIYKTAQTITKKTLEELDKLGSTYCFLSGTLVAPEETKNSILTVFNQTIKDYITKDNTNNIISITNFDITKIKTEKTALFINDNNKEITNVLIPVLISQIVKTVEIYNQKENKLNIVIKDFDDLVTMKNYSKILMKSKKYNINNLITIQGLITIENKYNKEDIRLVAINMTNLIYLYSQDLRVLREISLVCGNESRCEPLATIEELQRINQNEAIIKIPRLNPIKIDLIPDYEVKWENIYQK